MHSEKVKIPHRASTGPAGSLRDTWKCRLRMNCNAAEIRSDGGRWGRDARLTCRLVDRGTSHYHTIAELLLPDPQPDA